jgi:LmbE family N-acetylglucosaminyl deacetylase
MTALDHRSLCAVFAHPDDETFAIGGTLALYAADGVATHLYCATDGDAGRFSGVTLAPGETLAQRRRQELVEASKILGLRTLRSGGHPDGALAGVDQDVLNCEIVAFLRAHRPQIVITFGPEGGRNLHRDHRAICRATTAAFFLASIPTAYPEQLAGGVLPHEPARLFYAAWDIPGPHESLLAQSLPPDTRIDVRAFLGTKRAAFEPHVTQHEHRERFETLTLSGEEQFTLAAGRARPVAMLRDLFQDLPRD